MKKIIKLTVDLNIMTEKIADLRIAKDCIESYCEILFDNTSPTTRIITKTSHIYYVVQTPEEIDKLIKEE